MGSSHEILELRSGSKWQPQALTPTEAPEKSLMTATFVGQEMRQNATSMHRYLVPPEKGIERQQWRSYV